ncbi:MAG TPA: molybdopterin-dependent oxidoreductase, partial [Tepidisphaeraceae bacterium]
MSTQKPPSPDDEITRESAYLNRRTFMRAGIVAATAVATGLVYRQLNSPPKPKFTPQPLEDLQDFIVANQPATSPSTRRSAEQSTTQSAPPAPAPEDTRGFVTDEPKTTFQDITNYNNFYEFSTEKDGVAPAAQGFITRPWQVAVTGLCRKPQVFDLGDLLKIARPEERVYRMRCVEAWSMVIPWDGYSLSKLLNRVEPLSSAKYVAFQTLFDPKRMPNHHSGILDWPYVEGLRM